MEYIIDFLEHWGAWGMFFSAFLAGSVFPFSSEVVMGSLYAAGVSGWTLLWSATLGNVLGFLFNYWLGRMFDEEHILRHFKISHDKWERNKLWTQRYGYWAGFIAWIPVLGSVVTVALGFMRVNVCLCTLTATLGKLLRYIIILMALCSSQLQPIN
ncbi:MAG: DedA family protein [Bacteroidaceae bacterium]|nr:DedA family protein [Bacteroidaceae bacterium]